MLDSQEILISIDKRLVEARKEIASLEGALTAMRKRSTAAKPAASPRATRSNGTPRGNTAARTKATARGNGTARGNTTARTKATARGNTTARTKATARTNGTAPTGETPQPSRTARTDSAASANGRSRRPRRAAAKRRPQVVPAGKLVTLLGTSDGMSTAELVNQTGGDRQQLLTLLRELETAGEVRRSGERRNTRWHVITDEDRIAARVAELERQSSRRNQSA